MKYLVFVDIDGVLTSTRAHFADNCRGLLWRKFDPIAVEFFNTIHDKYDEVEFVLISTWRDWIDAKDTRVLLWIESAFTNAGFRGNFSYPHWKVNPEDNMELWNKRRAYEIKHYLEEYAPECKDYLIFDDSDYNFNQVLGKRRHIHTSCDDGILWKHMKKAMSITGNWDAK